MRSSMLGLDHPYQQYNPSQQYSLVPLLLLSGQRIPALHDFVPRNGLLLSDGRGVAAAADLAARQEAVAAEQFRLARIAYLEAQMAHLVREVQLSAAPGSTHSAERDVRCSQQQRDRLPEAEAIASNAARSNFPTWTGYPPTYGVAIQPQRPTSGLELLPGVSSAQRPTSGLELLTEVSMATAALSAPQKSSSAKKESRLDVAPNSSTGALPTPAKTKRKSSSNINRSDTASDCSGDSSVVDVSSDVGGEIKHFADCIGKWDVLCGRGGRSNHHPGNKRYREVVAKMKLMYRTSETKSLKTDLSRAIVEHVWEYGGRFLKMDHKTGRYYVLCEIEARKKTSQALREPKDLKWTIS